MTRLDSATLRHPAWRDVCCAVVAWVLLLGALITPWGLVTSHGVAGLSAALHETDGDHADSHSHEDGRAKVDDTHAHHGGDHSHETAHTLPVNLRALGRPTPVWLSQSTEPTPWPALAGLERPPKG